MNYYMKRIAVLKQTGSGFSVTGKVMSGIARIEKTGSQASVCLSLINIAPLSEGEYAVAAAGKDGSVYIAHLGKNPINGTFPLNGVPDMEDGLAVSLAALEQDKVYPVAFGIGGQTDLTEKDLFKAFQDSRLMSGAVGLAPLYDDDVVASENYFLNEPSYRAAQKDIQSIPEEILSFEGTFSETENLSDDGKDVQFKGDIFQETQKIDGQEGGRENEDGLPVLQSGLLDGGNNESKSGQGISFEEFTLLSEDKEKEDFSDTPSGYYFDSVKEELFNLLNSYPKDIPLIRTVPDSDFVRVDYGKDKFYSVGIVYKGKKPLYVCYGVPAAKRNSPPEELKGYCSFLPLKSPDYEGYWMMCQDASTGKCSSVTFL